MSIKLKQLCGNILNDIAISGDLTARRWLLDETELMEVEPFLSMFNVYLIDKQNGDWKLIVNNKNHKQ